MDPPQHGRLRTLVNRAFGTAALARMEARLGLEALLSRCGRLERGADPVAWHRTLLQRGPAALPLVLHPA